MMKTRNVLVCAVLAVFMYACNKSDTKTGCATDYGNPSAQEITNLTNYITTNGISATEDPRGFYYHIAFAGSGTESPAGTDTVEIKYRGALTNGTVFDSTATGETRKFPLNNLITGWQFGLPLLKRGGVIDLYLPPSDGYGCDDYGPIPGNSITVFHIELVNF